MNFFQYRCELVARVPRTWCRTDGVPSGASTLGPGRQRVHPDDGSARDATQCGDARRCHG